MEKDYNSINKKYVLVMGIAVLVLTYIAKWIIAIEEWSALNIGAAFMIVIAYFVIFTGVFNRVKKYDDNKNESELCYHNKSVNRTGLLVGWGICIAISETFGIFAVIQTEKWMLFVALAFLIIAMILMDLTYINDKHDKNELISGKKKNNSFWLLVMVSIVAMISLLMFVSKLI